MSCLKVFLLGSPRVERDDRPLKIERRKAMALLTYLGVAGGTQARDTLAALLWTESDQVSARTALRITLSALKKDIGEEWLDVERESVALKRRDDTWVDVNRFRQCLEACRKHNHRAEEACPQCINLLSEAVGLYRGDFLTGFSLRDSANFDDWQYFQAESLRLELSSILERLAQMHSAKQDFVLAIEHTRHWVELDALHEPAHRQLMQLYVQSGQPAAALRQYDACVHLLETELGIPPQEETAQLYHAIHKEKVFKVAPTPLRWGHNLPHHVTPFVGREQEIIDIGQLIRRTDSRLVCLTGPGGIGKTRLALEVAAVSRSAFLHDVFFIPLADVGTADYLASAIADGLAIGLFGQEDPKSQLLNYLCHKEILLVLDNFEHLMDGAGLLKEILAAAPGVKFLVTSRGRLSLQGEWIVEVGGLQFPKEGESGNIEAFSAVQLFVQLARRVCPGFRLGEPEKRCVVRICRLVEGMPLALELAASWTQALSCAEIADEIRRDLDFLSTSTLDMPDRHRSLRVTFNYSWGLLSPAEKETFTRLTVFRGGFDREAAQEVAQASPLLIAKLVGKSFLRWNAWTGRYEIHELLRQYALEELSASSGDETRDRHCAYFVDFLHQRESILMGEEQLDVLHEIGAEIENVRLAWQWAIMNGQKDRLERCLECLFLFYDIGSYFQEGRDAFAGAAALQPMDTWTQNADAVFWKLRVRQGLFEQRIGHYPEAQELLQSGLQVFRSLDNQAEMAFCLIALADVTIAIATYAEAAHFLEEALPHALAAQDLALEARIYLSWGKVCRILGDCEAAKPKFEQALLLSPRVSKLRADSLGEMGVLYHRLGRFVEARSYYEQSLHLCRQVGDRFGESATLIDLGNISFDLRDCEKSIFFHDRALMVKREIGDRRGEIIALNDLAVSMGYLGGFAEARRYLEQALHICREIKDRANESWVLGSLGLLCHRMGDDETSQLFIQRSLHLAQEIGDRPGQGYALTTLGHALVGLGELSRAAGTYRQAMTIWRDLNRRTLHIEPLAGLARIAQKQGELSLALEYVEEILSYLQVDTLDGAEEPQRVYLTCYQVLSACQDVRSRGILSIACQSLQEQAAKISDDMLRRAFLEDVAEHREITRLWSLSE